MLRPIILAVAAIPQPTSSFGVVLAAFAFRGMSSN
jgi:hypothetical protein